MQIIFIYNTFIKNLIEYRDIYVIIYVVKRNILNVKTKTRRPKRNR